MTGGRTRIEYVLGNGDPGRAKYWFIGPEASEDEKMDAQIWDMVWERGGANETCDVREIAMAAAAEFDTQAKSGVDDKLRKHWSEQAAKIRKNFDPQNCRLQRTWRDLIRLALSFEGASGPEDVAMRSFQCERLRTDCMLLECRAETGCKMPSDNRRATRMKGLGGYESC